jgi:DNA-binding NtrC family response regulator
LEEVCAEQGKSLLVFTDDAYEELKAMKWTGNIRELRNVVERLAILCDGTVTGADVKRFAQPLVR